MCTIFPSLLLCLKNITWIFLIFYRYIYGGVLSLNGQDASDILKVLVAADRLILQELVDYLQTYLYYNL